MVMFTIQGILLFALATCSAFAASPEIITDNGAMMVRATDL